MSTIVFTSLASNYLAKARVLYRSFKKHHPDVHFVNVLVDKYEKTGISSKIISSSADETLGIRDILTIKPNADTWIFKHNLMELCTAVKGAAFKHFFARGAKRVVFLDPDMWVLNSLKPVFDAFNDHSILLTPHCAIPETTPERISFIECGFLRHGTYNLGFLGVKNDSNGKSFVDWWNERLLGWCYIDYQRGLFTDQKWIDLVPAFFDGVKIFRDPGMNFARWNMGSQPVSANRRGEILINNKYPIRFFHFSGIESGDHDSMLERFAGGNPHLKKLTAEYKAELDREGNTRFMNSKNPFNHYSNGDLITSEQRQIYRQRVDLQKAFPHPSQITYDEPCFLHWYKEDLRRRLLRDATNMQTSLSQLAEFAKIAR